MRVGEIERIMGIGERGKESGGDREDTGERESEEREKVTESEGDREGKGDRGEREREWGR